MRIFYALPDSFLIAEIPDPRKLIQLYNPLGNVYVFRNKKMGLQRLNATGKEELKHTLHALGAFNHVKKATR